MHKILVILVILSLTLAGCCTGMSNGVETKSFGNCLTKGQDYTCNPPSEAMAAANAALPVITALLATLVPGTAPYVALVNNGHTAQDVSQGLCVTLTSLNALINLLKTEQAKAAQTKMLQAKAMPVGVDVQALINWEAMGAKHPTK